MWPSDLHRRSFSHGSPALHATLSTADLTLSINSAEVAHHRDSKNMANSNEFNVSFHIDNFLFSDDDDNQEARPITAVAGGPLDDIVPDSSDEASTGPALDMDLESADEDGLKHLAQSTTIDQDSYAHANASSGTRQGALCLLAAGGGDREMRADIYGSS